MTTELPASSEPSRIEPRLRFWRRVSLRKQMLYGFTAPILIVLMASLFLLRELKTLSHSADANVESTEAIGLRHALLGSVVDAETGLRGYLLTGDPEFLQPYSSAWLTFSGTSKLVAAREATNPAQLRELHAIEELFGRWKDYAAALIVLRQQTAAGEASQLWLLASMVVGPAPAATTAGTAGYGRDYDRALGRLQTSLGMLRPGKNAADLQAVLVLAGRTRTLLPEAAATTRAELLIALQSLAARTQADEDRISSTIASKRGKHLIDAIRVVIQTSLQEESVEQAAAARTQATDADHAIWIALGLPIIALLIGLALILLLLLDAVRAIDATSRAATAVAGGDLRKRLKVLRRDEIGELGTAFNAMAEELDDRSRRSLAINRFQTQLVISNSMEEIHAVVERMCTDMFHGASGAIYRIAASRNAAERVAQWNWPAAANGRVLHPEDCRAVRSGQPYFTSHDTLETPCRHIQQLGVPVARSLCMPLSAHGQIFGILTLCRFGDTVQDEASARDKETAILIGEQLSMSLANMQLREQLRNQSIRDPLTGLFNRRYLEETMSRELARTARNGQPLAVIAIDVDLFKRFNDTHGHEAGDKVLVELAKVLRNGIRTTDIACRYGGEEFVLLMPEASLPIAIERVEALRRQTRELRVRIGDIQLEPVTISSGIAIAPLHGENGDVLLRNADTALYAAKAAGRDRVIVYHAD